MKEIPLTSLKMAKRTQPQFESDRERNRRLFVRDVVAFLIVTMATLIGIILILHFSIKYGW